MERWIIRRASQDDIDGIVRVIAEAAHEDRWLRTPPGFDREKRSAQMRAAFEATRLQSFVAMADAKIIGEASLFRSTASASARLGMAVLQPWRGQGIGTALLETIELHARNERIGEIVLEVYAHNIVALRLYQRAGYMQTAGTSIETRASGEEFRVITMRKFLADELEPRR